jgi:hypothetical protein
MSQSAALENQGIAPDTSSFLFRYEGGREFPEVASPGEAAPAHVARLNSTLGGCAGPPF